MQPVVEMIHTTRQLGLYTTLKIANNINYITIIVTHLKHTHMHIHIHSNNTNTNNANNTNNNNIRSNLKLLCYAVYDEITSITGTFV